MINLADQETSLLLSIIVPVYNAESTLPRCLKSLLHAPCAQLEVIAIDDGSTDGSTHILAEYAARDPRLRIFSQNNQGVSAARNAGLDAARGTWASFVDNDDYVAEAYSDQLIEAFRQTNADVVFFEFTRVDNDGNILSHHALPNIELDYWHILRALSSADLFGYTWIKAFRRATISGVRFPAGMSQFEDEVFTAAALRNPLKLTFLRKELYCYVSTNQNSLSHQPREDYPQLCDAAYRAWKKLLQNDRQAASFLTEKANHFSYVCKYYGLERVSSPMHFFRKMSRCLFLLDSTLDDKLLNHIRRKRWSFVGFILSQYRIKTHIRNLFLLPFTKSM